MSLLACVGLFAAVVATWIAVSGPGPLLAWRTRLLLRSEGLMQRRAFLASYFGPGWLAGINERRGGALHLHAPRPRG